jgi:hypothetical protein
MNNLVAWITARVAASVVCWQGEAIIHPIQPIITIPILDLRGKELPVKDFEMGTMNHRLREDRCISIVLWSCHSNVSIRL